jgi:long-chain acyl-CoA synthetase
MASELDRQLNAIMDQLTAPGGPLETEPFARFGRQLPVLKHAPPTLSAFFAHYCTQHADLEFLVDGDIRLSFAEVHVLARRMAAGLMAGHGVNKGDRIGIAARNSANWIIAYMAIIMAGGCATLLNAWCTGDELAEAITMVSCNLVLVDEQRAERLAGKHTGASIIVFAHDDPAQGLAPLLISGEDADTVLPELTADDLATIVYTSGSTGQSKGAYSDHRGVVHGALSYAAQTLMAFMHLDSTGNAPPGQPSALISVPLFHVTGEVPLLLQSFVLGRKLVNMVRWDAEEAMRQIERERLNYFVGVPLMSIEIANHPRRGAYDLSSCRAFAAGGAPRPVDHVSRIRAALPDSFPILGYGLTETNGVGCGNFNENYLAKPGSTGPASRPLVEVAILDDAGHALPGGTTGEVAIRTICNFLGYWDNHEATAASLMPDGFFRTGDLGFLDNDDYLFIVDRKKDIIIRGGENISCIEVEQAIYAHPDIAEASVFGLADDRFGEVPAAVWLAKPGRRLAESDLRAFLMQRLAPFKIPVQFWQEADALPRLGTEKVDKRALKARYADRRSIAKAAE